MKFTKATLILRGYTWPQVQVLAQLLSEQGENVRNIEITLNTENAFEIIGELHKAYQKTLNIGAGTVQTLEELKSAVAAGAQFVLSPRMMTKEMLDYCRQHQVISVPGAFTASEIGQMMDYGADYIKIFPANELSMSYAKKVIEPLGNARLMAVGGVTQENVKAYFENGYTNVGTAGGIFKREDILSGNVEKLSQSLRAFEQEIG
jgi:2-dehydro-3-deoxyphosphogluconate aldolase/(4S)-4-hydroxy-2-oxoglutarate aldolase